MKIYIDATLLGSSKYSGIPWYLYYILDNIDVQERKNITLLSLFGVKTPPAFYKIEDLKMRKKLGRSRFFWLGGFKINKLGADVYWSPNFVIPKYINSKTKIITTVHDLIPFTKDTSILPKTSTNLIKNFFNSQIKYSVKKSDVIVTISENVANIAKNFFHINEKKIEVVSPAFDKKLFQTVQNAKEKFYIKYRIRDKFALTGNMGPTRKNFIVLIDAFKKVKANGLLCVFGNLSNQQINLAKKELGDKFKYLGYIKEEDLPMIYSAANVFIAPSRAEGFDMPSLEARACGTKVIASDIAIHHEVLENEAEYFDVNDIKNLSKLISDVLNVDKKIVSSKIINKYDWKKSADRMFEILTK